MLNAELKILAGKYQGKAIPLSTKRFLVGREQDCQLRPNSELVSRHHCVFVIDDYAVRLRDLGSTNGTRVNGDLLRGEVVLKPGDRIIIGRLEVELVVRQEGATPSNVSVPSAVDSSDAAASTVATPAAEAGTSVANAGDTSFEIPAVLPVPQEQLATVANIGGDTAIIPGANGAPMVPLAANPMMPMGYPMSYGFPGQMPGFMPGYGYGMPQGYPMGMPGMPMMPQYTQQYQQQPQQSGTAAAGTTTFAEPPVKLPDPSSTGAKAPVPAAPAAGGQPAAAAATENPSQSAADIIKQFMQRRST